MYLARYQCGKRAELWLPALDVRSICTSPQSMLQADQSYQKAHNGINSWLSHSERHCATERRRFGRLVSAHHLPHTTILSQRNLHVSTYRPKIRGKTVPCMSIACPITAFYDLKHLLQVQNSYIWTHSTNPEKESGALPRSNLPIPGKFRHLSSINPTHQFCSRPVLFPRSNCRNR